MKLTAGIGFVLAVAACGGGGGEDITGTIVIDWGTEHVVPDSGALVEFPATDGIPPGSALLGIGNSGIGCGWADDRISSGDTFVAIMLDPSEQAVGSYTPLILVNHADGSGFHSNGSSGTLEITAFGERVAGSLDVATTDDEAGAVTASGTFDVINCL
jgi:hypothetical protein